MAKVYVFLADGFEEIEALAPIDIMRRGGLDVTTVSIMDTEAVQSAHGVIVLADLTFAELEHSLRLGRILCQGDKRLGHCGTLRSERGQGESAGDRSSRRNSGCCAR